MRNIAAAVVAAGVKMMKIKCMFANKMFIGRNFK